MTALLYIHSVHTLRDIYSSHYITHSLTHKRTSHPRTHYTPTLHTHAHTTLRLLDIYNSHLTPLPQLYRATELIFRDCSYLSPSAPTQTPGSRGHGRAAAEGFSPDAAERHSNHLCCQQDPP